MIFLINGKPLLPAYLEVKSLFKTLFQNLLASLQVGALDSNLFWENFLLFSLDSFE